MVVTHTQGALMVAGSNSLPDCSIMPFMDFVYEKLLHSLIAPHKIGTEKQMAFYRFSKNKNA